MISILTLLLICVCGKQKSSIIQMIILCMQALLTSSLFVYETQSIFLVHFKPFLIFMVISLAGCTAHLSLSLQLAMLSRLTATDTTHLHSSLSPGFLFFSCFNSKFSQSSSTLTLHLCIDCPFHFLYMV